MLCEGDGVETVFGEGFADGGERSGHGFDETQHGISQGGEGLGCVAGSDPACVLAKGRVAAVVQPVFDAPVLAREGEQAVGAGALTRQAGDGVGDLATGLAGNLPGPLDAADLGGAGPLQIGDDFARQRKTADLETAVALVRGLGVFEVRRRCGGNRRRRRAALGIDLFRGEKRRRWRRRDRPSGRVGWP